LHRDDAPALCNDTGGSPAAGGAAAEAAASLGYKHSTTVFVQQLQAQVSWQAMCELEPNTGLLHVHD